MVKPILAPAVVVVILFGLAACQREVKVAAAPAPAAAPSVAEQPKLWSIEVMDGGKAVSRVDICADSAVRAGFARPAPELNGQPCEHARAPVEKGDTYSTRCHVDNQLYRVGAVIAGDTARDFTVEMAVTRQDRKGPTFEQVRRYRLLGACPAGWHIGESAAPGDKQLLDTISGARRPMPTSGG